MKGAAAVAGCVALAAVSGCGGGSKATIAIGVLGVCQGTFAPFYDEVAAGADLSLLARGGKLTGSHPSDGVSGARVSGHPVRFVFGCADESATGALVQARRLVEQDGVQIVVGPETSDAGIAVRDYARTKPHVPFLIAMSPAVEPTLERPAPNVFRFTTNALQWSAGLGTYAYRTLGWRRAVVVGNDFQYPYAEAASFIAEFCSLGGKIVKRVWGDPPVGVPRTRVDGYFMSEFLPQYLTAAVRAAGIGGELRRRLVLGAAAVSFAAQGALGDRGRGVVGGSPVPLGSSLSSWSRFLSQMKRAFTNIQPSAFAAGYYTSAEAALRALEATGGDLSHGTQKLMAALARTRFTTPTGPVRLNGHRQAIAPNYIVQVGKSGLRTLGSVGDVDDSYAGRFSPEQPLPGRRSPPCTTGNPPGWVR